MSDNPADRRREQRFEIGAHAVVRRLNDSDKYPAVTLNISGGGLLLQMNSNPFTVGDEVTCEIELAEPQEHPFANWGVGRVVWVNQNTTAIELQSGIFFDDLPGAT